MIDMVNLETLGIHNWGLGSLADMMKRDPRDPAIRSVLELIGFDTAAIAEMPRANPAWREWEREKVDAACADILDDLNYRRVRRAFPALFAGAGKKKR